MPQPTAFDRQTSFSLFSAENPGVPHTGADLDTEFNAVKVSLDETQANLELIQDDDGVLKRGSVGRAQLDASINLGFAAPAPWEASVAYEEGLDTVFYSLKFYLCAVTHVSAGTFEAAKWTEIADFTASAMVEDGSIGTPQLANAAVTAAKLGTGAVTETKIGAGAVTADKIADLAVTVPKLSAELQSFLEGVPTTGDVKLTIKSSAGAGWVMCDDGTIGDASSAASTRANADCEDLFLLLWTNISDTYAPVTGGRGASAAADWAAHKKIALTKVLGRVLGVAGAGSGLTSRALGLTTGAEQVTLATANLPAYTPEGSVSGTFSGSGTLNASLNSSGAAGGDFVPVRNAGSTAIDVSGSITGTLTGTAQGGTSTPFNISQPTTFLNVLIKL